MRCTSMADHADYRESEDTDVLIMSEQRRVRPCTCVALSGSTDTPQRCHRAACPAGAKKTPGSASTPRNHGRERPEGSEGKSACSSPGDMTDERMIGHILTSVRNAWLIECVSELSVTSSCLNDTYVCCRYDIVLMIPYSWLIC